MIPAVAENNNNVVSQMRQEENVLRKAVVAGSGWLWLALAGSGLFWVALAGSGWLWVIPPFSNTVSQHVVCCRLGCLEVSMIF